MKMIKRRDLPGTFGEWQEWFEDFFNTSPAGLLQKVGINIPAVNIREEGTTYLIEVAAPGMEKSDFNITLNQGVLSISSVHKEEQENKEDKYHRREFSYSAFSRSFTLPEDADDDGVSAKYDKGVLSVTVMRHKPGEASSAGRKIEIG